MYDDHVDETKPAPAAYVLALDWLSLTPADAVAIEDNVGGVRAARAAGLRCIAFPNANTAGANSMTPPTPARPHPTPTASWSLVAA